MPPSDTNLPSEVEAALREIGNGYDTSDVHWLREALREACRLGLATAEARSNEAVKHEHDAWVGALQTWLASRDVRVTVCGGKQVAIDLPSLLDDVFALLTADAEARHGQDLQSMADACDATRADYERRLADTAEERERELYARFVCLNNAHSTLEVAHAAAEARHAEREELWQALVEILSTPIGLRDYDELRRLRRALGLEG